jgi:Protein of unknown function, DUF547
MRGWLIVIVSLFFAGCASVPRPTSVITASPSISKSPPYEAWGRVLAKHVDEQGRVNFAGVARDKVDLDQFVAYIYDTGPNNRPELFPTSAHVLAFHINAYNALAMHKVISTGIPQTLAGLRKVSFFAFGKVQVGGEQISLYDYENKVIRALGDARIHMALNCMSVSCPRLPRQVFLPATVNEQLDKEAVLFFNETRNVEVDDAAKLVTLSEILKFYPADFLAKAPSLIAYANLYRNSKIPETYAVQFRPYDWTINRWPAGN